MFSIPHRNTIPNLRHFVGSSTRIRAVCMKASSIIATDLFKFNFKNIYLWDLYSAVHCTPKTLYTDTKNIVGVQEGKSVAYMLNAVTFRPNVCTTCDVFESWFHHAPTSTAPDTAPMTSVQTTELLVSLLIHDDTYVFQTHSQNCTISLQ